MFGLIPSRRNRQRDGGLMTTRSPLSELTRLRSDFDQLFERIWSDFPRLASAWETVSGFEWDDLDDRYVLRAEAPGFDPKDFKVELRGNQLVLTAEHSEEEREEQGSRRFAGKFYHAVTLPPGVEADQVEAHYRRGILEVHVPKSAEARAKRIPVKAD